VDINLAVMLATWHSWWNISSHLCIVNATIFFWDMILLSTILGLEWLGTYTV